jgi:hypothetical protein
MSLPTDIDSMVCPQCRWIGSLFKTTCPNGCWEPAVGVAYGGPKAPQRLWQVHRREREAVWTPPEHYGPARIADSVVKPKPRTKVDTDVTMTLVSLLGLSKRK